MTTTIRLAVIACVLFAASSVRAAADALPAAERIGQLEAAWNEAHLHGNADALDRLWAPSLTIVVPRMRRFKKPELLAMWRSMKVEFSEYSTSDVAIQVYGTTAVVTGHLRRSRNFGGRVATDNWLFTKTYVQLDGQWQVVAYHASEAPDA